MLTDKGWVTRLYERVREGKRISPGRACTKAGRLKELTHFAELQGIQPVWSFSCLFWGPGMEGSEMVHKAFTGGPHTSRKGRHREVA